MTLSLFTKAASISLLTLALAGVATAKPSQPGVPQGNPEAQLAKMTQVLQLNENQQTQLKALMEKNQAKHREIGKQKMALRQQIQQQKQAGATDADMLKLYEQRNTLNEQLHQLHQQKHAAMQNILTESQQVKWYDMRQKKHMGMKDGNQRPPMYQGQKGGINKGGMYKSGPHQSNGNCQLPTP